MKVVIVENEELPLKGLMNFVRSCGHDDVVGFASVEEAKIGLVGIDDPFIVLLDHDLGAGKEDGYVLCDWLRSGHPLGHVLPIVYLTGRLPPDQYVANQLERPFSGPTVYIAKTNAESQLQEMLPRFERQFQEVRKAVDEQAARRALATLASVSLDDEGGS